MRKNIIKLLILAVISIIVISCGGGNSSVGNVSFKGRSKVCSSCNGTGLCHSCNGQGYFVINYQFGTISDCVHCVGGTCQNCGGDGVFVY